jgi:hypothetical protein
MMKMKRKSVVITLAVGFSAALAAGAVAQSNSFTVLPGRQSEEAIGGGHRGITPAKEAWPAPSPRDDSVDPPAPDRPDPLLITSGPTIPSVPDPMPIDCPTNPYAAECLATDPEAIHAASKSSTAIQIAGNNNVFNLPVISGGGITVKGNGNRFSQPVSSTQSPVTTGNNNSLGPSATTPPNYLPEVSELAQTPAVWAKFYSAQSCPSGSVTLNATQITGPIISECELIITGDNAVVTATIASSQPVRVTGNNLTFQPTFLDNAFLVVTAKPNALTLSGNTISVAGRIRTNGTVSISGNNAKFCRIEAVSFSLAGNNATSRSCASS